VLTVMAVLRISLALATVSPSAMTHETLELLRQKLCRLVLTGVVNTLLVLVPNAILMRSGAGECRVDMLQKV
jgi:hypothetical protein